MRGTCLPTATLALLPQADACGRLDVAPELAALSEILLPKAALLPHLPPDGASLYIVPHHLLHGVPFCALPHPRGGANAMSLGDAFDLGQLAARRFAASHRLSSAFDTVVPPVFGR